MNLLDEHAQATNKVVELTNTLEIKKRLRQTCLDELKSFTPVYKDFPVLVARAEQLQKDIKDCDEVIPQLELDLKILEQRANEIYKVICNTYDLRMDYTTGNRVWVNPSEYDCMLTDLNCVNNMNLEQLQSKLADIQQALHVSMHTYNHIHYLSKYKYMDRVELLHAKDIIKDAIARQNKPITISKNCKWFSWR